MSLDLLGALAAGEDPDRPDRDGPGEALGDGGAPCCSRRGCRADAAWALDWNNPRLHAPERRKTWAACDAHRDHLRTFLDERGLLRAVRPLTPPAPPSTGASA